MFGGLYPDGTGTAGPELLQDLTLEKIDYDWIKTQTKASFLKKAIKIIEEDGNYFKDLKDACIARLIQIDPSKAPKVFNNNINETEKRKIDQDINSWEQEVSKKEQAKMSNAQKIFEMTQENSSSNTPIDLLEEQRKIKAENEKNKGNEALKSKDYKEAIEYYTKSIEYDPKLAASYCNRALVYLKLKEYEKVITDCNIAIGLDNTYLKAYHRRGKARFAQDKVYEAYCDFKFIMEREPDNKDVNGDLKECQEILKKQNTDPEKGFKRVQIVEEEDGDNDEEGNEDEEKVEMSDYSEVIIQSAKDKARQKHQSDLTEIEEKKEKANTMIKNGLFDQAIQLLKQCLSSIESLGSASTDKEDVQDFQKKKANYLNNLALCYKQLDDNHSVINYAQQVLAMKKSLSSDVLVKAYLRRGMAYERLEKYKRSLRDFQKVKHLEPGNLQSSQGMRRVQQCVKFDNDVLSASEDEENIDNNGNNGQLVVEEVEEEEMVLVKKPNGAKNNTQEKKEQDGQQGKLTGNSNVTTTTSNSTSKTSSLETLIKQKEQANTLFTSKDINGALQKFKDIAREIELKYASQLNSLEESVLSLYEQVLSNECLCLLNLQKYTETITCATSALHYRELNIKCLYRRAQALKALADQEETSTQAMTLQQLQQSYDKYEKSRKDLEKVVSIDPVNKPAKQLLQDVSRKAIEVKLALRKAQSEIEGKQQKEAGDNQTKEQKDEETDTSKNSKPKSQEAAPITKNLNTQELHDLTQQALQTAAENLVKQFKLPESQTEFEREFTSLKSSSGNSDKLYGYIKQIPGEYFAKSIYDKNDIPSNILIAIIKALKEYGTSNSEDKETSQKIVKGLTQTAKFHLCAKFITKKEKQEIKELLEAIDLAGDTELLLAFKIQA